MAPVHPSVEAVCLAMITKHGSISGTKVQQHVHADLRMHLSMQSIYRNLKDLESRDILESEHNHPETVYSISDKQQAKSILQSYRSQHMVLGMMISEFIRIFPEKKKVIC